MQKEFQEYITDLNLKYPEFEMTVTETENNYILTASKEYNSTFDKSSLNEISLLHSLTPNQLANDCVKQFEYELVRQSPTVDKSFIKLLNKSLLEFNVAPQSVELDTTASTDGIPMYRISIINADDQKKQFSISINVNKLLDLKKTHDQTNEELVKGIVDRVRYEINPPAQAISLDTQIIESGW